MKDEQKEINQKLNFFQLLPGITSLLPRIPSIIKNIKNGLAINADDAISIGSILEENAVKYKDSPALLFEDKKYTHAEFNSIINQYAHYFIRQGVKSGDSVVVFFENRPATLFIVGALSKIGAVASLINANQRAKVLVHSINLDVGTHIIIGEELVEAFEEVKKEIVGTDTQLYWMKDTGTDKIPAGYIDIQTEAQKMPTVNPPTTKDVLAKSHYANVFTSGTTGLPKAAIQTHKKWITCYYWFGKVNMNLNANDVLYVPIPFFHTNALTVAWPSASSGGAAIAMRRKFSTTNFWKDAVKFNASAFIYIGEVCRYLMSAPPTELDKKHNVTKIIGNGLRPDIWVDFKNRFGIKKVFELYGSADGNIGFTNSLNIDSCVGWCPGKYAIVKYDVENEEPILDANGFFQKVKKGEAGLLLGMINDALPFAGYVDKKQNDKKIFRDVFEKGDSWFNTGDLMRDIGFKHAQFVDRLGDTFRWKGENVSTAEVEEIYNVFPGIQTSAVYGVQLPKTDGRAGMAAIQLKEGTTEIDFGVLVKKLRHDLPPYAVPLFLRICPQFEMTATHKIKKFGLKQDGIQPDHSQDPIFVLLPKTETYVSLTKEIQNQIKEGQISF
ncbi:MAG: long-chain-acyl-CoA synthetase [Bacteroidota bacterium]